MQPNSSLALQVTFHPRVEAASNYNVACLVKRKPSRLMLNVKGEGYAVHNSLQMETADGQVVHLSPDVPNSIDFGQVCGVVALFLAACLVCLEHHHHGQRVWHSAVHFVT